MREGEAVAAQGNPKPISCSYWWDFFRSLQSIYMLMCRSNTATLLLHCCMCIAAGSLQMQSCFTANDCRSGKCSICKLYTTRERDWGRNYKKIFLKGFRLHVFRGIKFKLVFPFCAQSINFDWVKRLCQIDSRMGFHLTRNRSVTGLCVSGQLPL